MGTRSGRAHRHVGGSGRKIPLEWCEACRKRHAVSRMVRGLDGRNKAVYACRERSDVVRLIEGR